MSEQTVGRRGVAAMPVLLVLFAGSGALGLIYEVLWLRRLILVFGSTTFAVSTVLTAFMGGLALGSFLFGRVADRLRRPVAVYGWIEIAIGLYALAVPFLFDALGPVYRYLWAEFRPSFYVFSLLRFACALLVLAVPTVLMGGTLPLLSRFVVARDEVVGRGVGLLYALNTAGAVLGTYAAGFHLLPSLGMRGTLWLAAAGNLAVGGLALLRYGAAAPARPPTSGEAAGRRPVPRRGWILAAVALSGGVAMIYEVAWARVTGLVIGGSVYAFTIMLSTFLVGLAAGAAAAARIADRLAMDGARLLGWLLAGVGAASFLALMGFHQLPYLFALALQKLVDRPGLVFVLKYAVAFAVMFVPTFLLGGVFPLAIRACSAGADRVGRTVGTVYAANTVGTILGSFSAGFLLLPLLGVRTTLLLGIVADLFLAAVLLGVAPGSAGRRLAAAGVCLALAAGLPAAAPAWDALIMNSGMYLYATEIEDLDRRSFREYLRGHGVELRYARDGATASIIVVWEPDADNLFLATNGKVDASSRFDLETQILSGHLPVLLASDPRRVMVIGYASGITVGSVLTHPQVEHLTAVEIEKAVLEAAEEFKEYNNDPPSDPRTEIVINDARNFLQVDDGVYDVIISEPSNPWITVASNLFTREAFEIGRSRLAPDGVYCQWIQMYGITPENLKAVLRTFQGVFPEVLVFTTIEKSDLVLMGSAQPLRFDLADLRARMRELSVAVDLARVNVLRVEDLLSFFTFGSAELREFTGGSSGPLNTDDNALIEFATPRSLHLPTGDRNTRALAPLRASPEATLREPLPGPEERAAFHLGLARAYARRDLPGRAREAARESLQAAELPGARDLLESLAGAD